MTIVVIGKASRELPGLRRSAFSNRENIVFEPDSFARLASARTACVVVRQFTLPILARH
jgi:hypothetical protein